MKSLYQKAFKVLEISLGEAHSWAVKLFMPYRYGRPKEIMDTHLFVEQRLFVDENYSNSKTPTK